MQKFKGKVQGDLEAYKKKQEQQLKEFVKIERNWNKITTGTSRIHSASQYRRTGCQ